jgi:hypothetical protein
MKISTYIFPTIFQLISDLYYEKNRFYSESIYDYKN